jgi:uncharacterized membrane protein YgcG
MEFKQSDDQDRIMSRQLYRAGQNQPASKTAVQASLSPSSKAPAAGVPTRSVGTKKEAASKDKQSNGQRLLLMILLLGFGYYLLYGTPPQRKRTFISLGVIVWLLALGSFSYCLNLPDLAALNKERMAIFQDRSLTPEQRREKFEQLREKEKNLTPTQRRQMGELMRKEFDRKRNADMVDFLKMSPEQQVAFLKKRAEEWEKRRKEWEQRRQQFAKAGGNRNGGPGGNRGGPGGRGGGTGGPGGGGPPPGFGGGGGSNAADAARLDRASPESRAGSVYQRALMAQMGLGGSFGRGGPGGGGGGGGRR